MCWNCVGSTNTSGEHGLHGDGSQHIHGITIDGARGVAELALHARHLERPISPLVFLLPHAALNLLGVTTSTSIYQLMCVAVMMPLALCRQTTLATSTSTDPTVRIIVALAPWACGDNLIYKEAAFHSLHGSSRFYHTTSGHVSDDSAQMPRALDLCIKPFISTTLSMYSWYMYLRGKHPYTITR